VIVLMEHCDSKGKPKLLETCSCPLTAPGCVDVVVTDLAQLEWIDGRFVVTAMVDGFTVEEIKSITPMKIGFADQIRSM